MFFIVNGKWPSNIAQVCNTYIAQLLLRKSRGLALVVIALICPFLRTLINDENLAVAKPYFSVPE